MLSGSTEKGANFLVNKFHGLALFCPLRVRSNCHGLTTHIQFSRDTIIYLSLTERRILAHSLLKLMHIDVLSMILEYQVFRGAPLNGLLVADKIAITS